MSNQILSSEAVLNIDAAKANKKKALVGIASLLVVVASVVLLNISNTQIQGVGTYRNWSADAIIQGGAITEKELVDKYDQNASGVQSVFQHYGIQRTDLTGSTSDIKHGTIYQDGRVVVEGKTVARGAYSLSRKPFYDMSGNAPKTVTINGSTFYEGPNMSIFVRSVDAYVYYRNNQFYRAVISSCANPVMATAVAQDKPVVPVTAPTPAPTPAPAPTPSPAVKPAAVPVYRCDNLTARPILGKDRTYGYMLNYTAENGAVLSKVTYDFGDSTTETAQAKDVNNVEHQYAGPGTYTTTATLFFTVTQEGKATDKSESCTAGITIAKPDNCAQPGKEHLPKNSPDCTEPLVVTPAELPRTGLEEWLAGGVGIAALAATGYYWKASRRHLKTALLKHNR